MLKLNLLNLTKSSLYYQISSVKIVSFVSIICNLLLLIGWCFNIDFIISGYGLNRVSIKANTAICFILLGIALRLLLLNYFPRVNQNKQKKRSRRLKKLYLKFFFDFHQWLHFYADVLAKVAVGLVVLISSLTLIEYGGNLNLGIDELIFIDASPISGTSYPGRMGLLTAVNFILIGIAMILLSRKKASRYDGYGQVICLTSAAISLLVLVNHGGKKVEITNSIVPSLQFMGLYQALTFLILCMGILCMSSNRGLMGMAMEKLPGHPRLWRWLLLSLSIPTIAGWLIIQGLRLNYYNSEFAIALFALGAIAFLAILIWEFSLVIEKIQGQRNHTKKILQKTQSQLQTIFDTNVLGIICSNINGGIQQANDQFLQMSGYGRDELISGKINWLEIVSPEFTFNGELTTQPHEQELLCKDGSHVPVLCNYRFLPGNQTEIIAYVFDLSDRHRLKIARKQDQRRIKLLQEVNHDITACSHPKLIIETWFAKLASELDLDMYWNYLVENNSPVMHLQSYSGISPKLAESMEYMEIVTHEPSQIVLRDVQQSTDPKTALIRSAGVQAYYSQVLRVQGKLLGTIAFASCRRSQFSEKEQAIMAAVSDCIAIAMERWILTNCVQQQAEQLQDTNRIRDEFLTILSHELRSPLQSILGWAQLLRSRNLHPDIIDKGLDAIERNAKIQSQIVEDLLDISRMIKGKLSLNICNCDLIPILQTVVKNVKLATEAKGIDFSYSLDVQNQHYRLSNALTTNPNLCIASKFLVSGDPERLQQIIWNLLSNAIKFTSHGGRVEIILSQVKDVNLAAEDPWSSYAQIQVKDTGIGIDSELIPYIFDRFYQTDSSNTRLHGGMGLGLAIVRHLVELHGGIIEVSSPGIGKGTVFTVKLPLLKIQSQPLGQQLDETITSSSDRCSVYYPSAGSINLSPQLLQGVRVLIVDAEAESQDFLLAVLQSYQARTQAASSVLEAMNIIREHKPDVLVCNMEMPQEDGYSLIRQLRSLENTEKTRKIPAAALTANDKAEQRMRAIHEGYQMYLFKPVEPCELVTVVACLAGRI